MISLPRVQNFFNRSSNEKGSVMVETAIVSSVFVLLVVAIFEFGYLISQLYIVSQASRAMVRTSSVASTDCVNIAETTFTSKLKSFGVPIDGFSASAQVSGDQIIIDVEGSLKCSFCQLIVSDAIDYKQQLIVRLEQGGC
jgi:hypothetical protein